VKVYEITAAGFDASSDETDSLVYWVAAESEKIVRVAVQDTAAVFCGEVLGWSLRDVDYTLPAQAVQLSTKLLQHASDYRARQRGLL
jgi:hypothetical protein